MIAWLNRLVDSKKALDSLKCIKLWLLQLVAGARRFDVFYRIYGLLGKDSAPNGSAPKGLWEYMAAVERLGPEAILSSRGDMTIVS